MSRDVAVAGSGFVTWQLLGAPYLMHVVLLLPFSCSGVFEGVLGMHGGPSALAFRTCRDIMLKCLIDDGECHWHRIGHC